MKNVIQTFYSCENLSSHLQKVCWKILVNVGIVHLELTARLYFSLISNGL